jgi:hypothetical protein
MKDFPLLLSQISSVMSTQCYSRVNYVRKSTPLGLPECKYVDQYTEQTVLSLKLEKAVAAAGGPCITALRADIPVMKFKY